MKIRKTKDTIGPSITSVAVYIYLLFFFIFSSAVAQNNDNYNQSGGMTITSFCAGGYHACAVFDKKLMKCWGNSFSFGFSSLKNDKFGDQYSDLGENLPYVNFGPSENIDKLSCGVWHTCMVLSTKKLSCVGYGPNGEIGSYTKLGDGASIVFLSYSHQIIDLALGNSHTCGLFSGGFVKCIGQNKYGELGQGDTISRGKSYNELGDNLPFINLGLNVTAASIHSGTTAAHICVILSSPINISQKVKCWGSNDRYQLGYGDKNNRGDYQNEMGDFLPLVDLGEESRVNQIVAGNDHTCMLLVNDVLKCIGDQLFGQLGSGTTATNSLPGSYLPKTPLDEGRNITMMSAGLWHTCIVYEDQMTIKCLGYNGHGQLGQGDKLDRGRTINLIFPNIPAIDLGTNSLKISSIHCGSYFTCVVYSDLGVKCFGDNEYGQLAIGSIQDVGDQINEMGNYLQYAMLFTIPPTLPPTPLPSSFELSEGAKAGLISFFSIVALFILIFIFDKYFGKKRSKQNQGAGATQQDRAIELIHLSKETEPRYFAGAYAEIAYDYVVKNLTLQEIENQMVHQNLLVPPLVGHKERRQNNRENWDLDNEWRKEIEKQRMIIEQRRLARWNERRKQLVTVYKINFPELGPDFEGLVSDVLQTFTFADIVKRIQIKDPNAILPSAWLEDLKIGYELGMEPLITAIVVENEMKSQLNIIEQ